jgi:hypothetical protein
MSSENNNLRNAMANQDGDTSPYSKSKTGKFENDDSVKKRPQMPNLRKTLTMKKDVKPR